ncbi:MAG: alpha/beta fold hydrolase [Gaiellaceae bacterium]
MTPRTRYARSGEIELAYQVLGKGEVDVVLVLDWASHLEALWEQPLTEEFVLSLARFARVLWFDMRGIGMSDPVPGGAAAPEDWVDDVTAVMDAVGSERATVVAQGHAAQMALMAAATHPERIESLVLYNGFARLARADDYPTGMPESAHEAVLEMIETTWGTGALAASLAPSVADRPGVTEWWGRVERFAGTPRMALAKARTIHQLDLRHVLPLVAAPTLVIQSRDNTYVRAGHSRYLVEHLPDAVLVELDSADHWPLPSPELLGAIEEFVTGSRRDVEDSDRVLATVLVVDIAGSTEKAIALGDRRWSAARDRSKPPPVRSSKRTAASSSTSQATGSSRRSTVPLAL